MSKCQVCGKEVLNPLEAFKIHSATGQVDGKMACKTCWSKHDDIQKCRP